MTSQMSFTKEELKYKNFDRHAKSYKEILQNPKNTSLPLHVNNNTSENNIKSLNMQLEAFQKDKEVILNRINLMLNRIMEFIQNINGILTANIEYISPNLAKQLMTR